MSGKISDFLSSASSLSAGLWKTTPTAKNSNISISKSDASTIAPEEKKDSVIISNLGKALQGEAGNFFGRLDDKLKKSLTDLIVNGKMTPEDLGEALKFAGKMAQKPKKTEENDYPQTQEQENYENAVAKMNMVDQKLAKGEISHKEYSQMIRSAASEVQKNFGGARLSNISTNGPVLIDQEKVDSYNDSLSNDNGRKAFLDLQNSGIDVASLMKSLSK